MKPEPISAAICLILLAVPLHAQRADLKRTDITAPRYDSHIIEITAASLQRMEASADWVQCRNELQASLLPIWEGIQSQMETARKLGPARMEYLKKQMVEGGKRAQKAKTNQEKMAISNEVRQNFPDPAMVVAVAEALRRDEELKANHGHELAAKCGAEPVDSNDKAGVAHFHMINRVAAFCQVGPAEIGADGSVALDPQYRHRAAYGATKLVLVYSKAEAEVLRPQCVRLAPLLREAGVNWK